MHLAISNIFSETKTLFATSGNFQINKILGPPLDSIQVSQENLNLIR